MHNDNLPGLTPLWLIVLAAILVFMLPTGVAFMSDDLGALFFEMKTAKKITPIVLAKHVQAWRQSCQLLVGLRNKMHGHVEGELDRIGHVVSELEERLFTK